MQIWNYSPTTGELIGPGTADPSPVEPGEWLVPAHATPVSPGPAQAGCAYQFNGSGWASVPDHRGEIWWKVGAEFNTEPFQITTIGDPAAFDPPLTNVEPPAPPVVVPPLVVSPRQIRLALTQMGMRAPVEAWVQAADQDVKDNWQYAESFTRGNNLVEAAAEDLKTSPEDVDTLFALAKTL